MNKSKYRVVQTDVDKFEIQEYMYYTFDVRTGESICDWIKISEAATESIAKKIVDDLVEKSIFPKVVYER